MLKRAIVTGGCGFIGGYVVKKLLEENYSVTVIDNLSQGKQESLPKGIDLVVMDICDYEGLLSVVKEGDTIFHLAALTSVPGSIETPLPYHTTNITGTYNVLEAARVKKARGIIFSSSAAVYGSQKGTMTEQTPSHPESPYAVQKHIGEELCETYALLYSLPCVCLRYFNVYGKGNHEEGSYAPVTARFLKAKREGRRLSIIGNGMQTRDFIHVSDVAQANVRAAELLATNTHNIINVCSGVSSKIIDIATTIGGNIEYLPARTEIKHSLGDPSKLYTLIPQENLISLKKGLEEMLST
jgi:UDP-glucose 4-epimerase